MQNDILKEYVARGNYIFPPRPSMRITTDLFAYCRERLPKWNTISISGYHIREAGSTAVQELGFTLAHGIAYCQAAVDAGLSPDEFGERLSFFFNAHNHFFQEVAKFRAARTLWARIMSERFGATNPKAQALRFHAQTGGSTLTAQQPENNIVRVAIQALSAVCGGAQSIHTNGFDEALALPTERAARIALRTQQVLANEAGGTDTADPLGGAYFLESLTRELEERAWALIERVDELGGAVAAVEQGFTQHEIEDAAYEHERALESGEDVARRRQPLRRGRRRRGDRAAPARPRGRAAPGRAHCAGSCGPRCARPRRRRLGGCATRRGEPTTSFLRCGRRSQRTARSGRSATPCATSSARTTPTRRRDARRRCRSAEAVRGGRRAGDRGGLSGPRDPSLDGGSLPVHGGRRSRVARVGRGGELRRRGQGERRAARIDRRPLFDGGIGEVGYWVKREARGRGVATRALGLVARWALVDKELGRFQLRADVANEASQRVAEKAGFVREGILRSALALKGERRDVIMYSLVREDL